MTDLAVLKRLQSKIIGAFSSVLKFKNLPLMNADFQVIQTIDPWNAAVLGCAYLSREASIHAYLITSPAAS
jgi:hypothetical protein